MLLEIEGIYVSGIRRNPCRIHPLIFGFYNSPPQSAGGKWFVWLIVTVVSTIWRRYGPETEPVCADPALHPSLEGPPHTAPYGNSVPTTSSTYTGCSSITTVTRDLLVRTDSGIGLKSVQRASLTPQQHRARSYASAPTKGTTTLRGMSSSRARITSLDL